MCKVSIFIPNFQKYFGFFLMIRKKNKQKQNLLNYYS